MKPEFIQSRRSADVGLSPPDSGRSGRGSIDWLG